MKAIQLIKPIFAAAVLFVFASSANASIDKTSEKAREAVENAEPNDWYTLARSAEKCLRKKVNLEEANKWIKNSILIDKNEYNLTLKGDYHLLIKEPVIACEYYLEAIKVAQEENRIADISNIQSKIYEAKKQIYK